MFVEGEIGDYQVVSVPETTSYAAAQKIREQMAQALKKSVMITTHNISFVRVERLSTAEAAKVLREIDEQLLSKPVVPTAELPPAPIEMRLDANAPDGVQK